MAFGAKPTFMFMLLAAMAMATQVSCHYVSCKNVNDVLQTPTFEVKNKLGEVVKATYNYPSNVAEEKHDWMMLNNILSYAELRVAWFGGS
jgi:hypothetical protein